MTIMIIIIITIITINYKKKVLLLKILKHVKIAILLKIKIHIIVNYVIDAFSD